MADSTLDPDYIPAGKDRSLGRGHGTGGLGPSDNSDSGSDVANDHDLALGSDTDAQGTGERIDVGSQTLEAGDIGFDHVEAMPTDGSVPEEHLGIDAEADDSRGDSDTEVKGDIEGGEALGQRTGGVPIARP